MTNHLKHTEAQKYCFSWTCEAEAICTTTIAGGNDFLSKLATFEAILVDEVAQATELSTLVPIVLRGARRLVLVGDHCQLPPSVQSPEAELRGLSVSVYTRLVQAGGVEPFLLDTSRWHSVAVTYYI